MSKLSPIEPPGACHWPTSECVMVGTKETLTASIENHVRQRASVVGMRVALAEAHEALAEAQKRVGFQYPNRLDNFMPRSAYR